MKNFRKVLALVLVVATLFSFATMAGAAYKDEEAISYEKAVDVLSAVGVLNGYEDETFKPTNTISREEMAKMIAVLANAGDDVSKLYASANTFADVEEARWSASYIAYCAQTGIVAGRTADTFDPYGKVTGLETAKMLLVTLGFDAAEQGYVGANWKINVLRDAKNMNLLGNFAAGYDVEAAITREQAANMMLNALMAKVVVGVLSDDIVKVTNATYKQLAGATLIDASKKGIVNLYGNVLVSSTTLWAALYGGELGTVNSFDCFGRPAAVWTYTNGKGKTETIGTYPVAAAWSSYDTNATELNKKLDEYDGTWDTIEYVLNGQPSSKAAVEAKLGNGVEIELYAYAKTYTISGKEVTKTQLRVVAIETFMGYVGHVNTANGKVAIKDASKAVIANIKNVNGFTWEDEWTVVSYQKCGEDQIVHAVEVLEPATVTLHGNRNWAGYFCDSAEKEYEYNATATKKVTDDMLGKEAYVYVDKFGFVLAVELVPSTTNVSVLARKSAVEDSSLKNNYDGVLYSYTAKFIEFAADPAKGDAVAVNVDMFNLDKAQGYDRLVEWKTNAAGERELVAKATKAPAGVYTLKAGKGTIGGLNLAGDANTQYILRLYNADTGAYVYKYFDGCGAIDGTYKLNDLQYFTAYDNDPHKAGRFVSYVYADASYMYAPSTAFVLKFVTDEAYWTGGDLVDYYLYNAIINGEEAYVAYEKACFSNGLNNDGKANALSNAVNNPTNPYVFTVVKADYVKVIADTHNDKPIYLAKSIEPNVAGEDYLVNGNVLSYIKAGATVNVELAEGANITIALKDKNNVTGDVERSVIYVADYVELMTYLKAHGWTTVYGWADYNTDGEVTDLYLYIETQE